MVRLVDDLLDISRISLGKVDLRLGSVDVAEILSQAIEQTRPAIEAAGHRLNVVAPSEPVVLNADRGRLAQAVANLLNNSCKYSDSGGQIDIFVERQGDTVLIRVRDAGVGIAPEMLPRVFDLFTQVDQSLSRSQGGLGIGLSLVRSLVEMHGGTVTALSGGLGMGSEFTVQLPATAGGAYPLIPQPACGAAGRARRILVVDDNRDSALSLAAVCSSTQATSWRPLTMAWRPSPKPRSSGRRSSSSTSASPVSTATKSPARFGDLSGEPESVSSL